MRRFGVDIDVRDAAAAHAVAPFHSNAKGRCGD